MYAVDGRDAVAGLLAFLVTLTARIGLPWTVRPIVTTLVSRGYRAATAAISSRMPPGSL